MRDRRAPEATGIVIAALMVAIAAIPLVFAVKDSPAHWRVTSSSLWGGR